MGRKDKKPPVQSPPPPAPGPEFSSDSDPEPESATSSDDDDAVSSPSHHVTQPRNTPLSPPSKKHVVATTPAAARHSDDEESEEEEESDDEKHSHPSVVKPALTPASKPKPKASTNPRPTVAALPTSSAKRPAQNDVAASKLSEKKAKPPSTPAAPAPTPPTPTLPHKQLFQRVWSEEDEIQILKGMIEYRKSRGVPPLAAPEDFVQFMRRSVHVADFKKDQLVNKIRRLKRKFVNAQKKKSLTDKERVAFELGNKIWGPDVGMTNGDGEEEEEEEEEDEEPEPLVEQKQQQQAVVVDNHKKQVAKVATEEKKKAPPEAGSVECFGDELVALELGFSDMNARMLKGVVARLEGAEEEEMRRQIKKANEASLEAYLLRMEVLKLAAKKLLDSTRST